MRISELSPAKNSRTAKRRLGRGTGSGLGKTSGKGQKGQNSRSGGGVRLGFEGGQMSLVRKLPKVGFTNHCRTVYSVINVEDLEKLDATGLITVDTLRKAGLVSKLENGGLKVLGNGNLTKAIKVQANKFSALAIKKIKDAGGEIEVL